eukprot:1115536-Amorphochlora_amoeboformis.AAC.1
MKRGMNSGGERSWERDIGGIGERDRGRGREREGERERDGGRERWDGERRREREGRRRGDEIFWIEFSEREKEEFE